MLIVADSVTSVGVLVLVGSIDNTSAAAGTTAADDVRVGVATENASQTEDVPAKATKTTTSGNNLILVKCMQQIRGLGTLEAPAILPPLL